MRRRLRSLFSRLPMDVPVSFVSRLGVDDIREQMDSLAALADGQPALQLRARLRRATSVEALWFLRSELMALLGPVIGEAAAIDRLCAITDLFEGLLPSAYRPRRSPLGANGDR